jgi:hypothetical protein
MGRSRPSARDAARRATARPWRRAAIALLLCAGIAGAADAQDLEPRAYSASPVGASFLVAGFGRSTGSVVFDPTLPFRDVDARVNAVIMGTGTTFGLAGRLALASVALPISWGRVSGRVGNDPTIQHVDRSGLADLRAKLSVNVIGNPAMRARAFAAEPRRAVLGVSLTATAPVGQYKGTQLINLGTNRWAFKPEIGLSVPAGRWDFDAYAGVWLFTKNPDFYTGGLERTQDPVTALQAHVSYTLRPRLWLAADGTWYSGGEATVENGAPGGGVNNSRVGVTLSLPAGRQQSFKISYSTGVSVRTGSDFDAIAVGWQWLWLRP